MKTLFSDKRQFILVSIALVASSALSWSIPYGEMDMIGRPFLLKWSVAGLVIGGVGTFVAKRRPMQTSVLVAVGFILSVIIRIVFDTIADPSSHNLLPFEIVIATIAVLPPAALGAWLATLLQR